MLCLNQFCIELFVSERSETDSQVFMMRSDVFDFSIEILFIINFDKIIFLPLGKPKKEKINSIRAY